MTFKIGDPGIDASGYMTPEHPLAFLDMLAKEEPKSSTEMVLCHVCQGRGGWHLKLFIHPQPYPHFNAFCSQCWGWGWVEKGSPDDLCSRHQWAERNIGRCLHEWTCKLGCGATRTVDSSD